ncbi:MAG: hypothetical protein IPJ40_13325 [Saprospirales bacterium]|nr:hypothetical protein [Saprospirales bacterium]
MILKREIEKHAEDWPAIVAAFHQIMKFKGHEFIGINQMINEENDMRIRAAWDNSLRHQIPKENFVDYEVVRAAIVTLLTQIFE